MPKTTRSNAPKLDRFLLHVAGVCSTSDAATAAALSDVPWTALAAAAERELRAYLRGVAPKAWRAVLFTTDQNGAGRGLGQGILVDASDTDPAFADGPVDPRLIVQAGAFGQAVGSGAEVSVVHGSLALLCAEVLRQRAPTLHRTTAWAIATAAEHDERPRVVWHSDRATDIFDATGALVRASPAEAIAATPAEGVALAALVAKLPRSADTMELLGKVDAVFLRVARSGDVSAHRPEVRALVDALVAHHKRLDLMGWGEMYETVISKAVVCTQGDRALLDTVVEQLVPHKALTVSALAFNVACLYALSGARAQALQWVQRALALGHDKSTFADTDFDSIRDDPAFARLLHAKSADPKTLVRKLAAAADDVELAQVEALLLAGANPNGVHDGDPVVVIAARASAYKEADRVARQAIVARLLDAGARVKDADWPWYAIQRDPALVQMLLQRGVKATDALLRTAVEKEDIALLKTLVDTGVKLAGRGAFFYEACRHHKATDTVAFLLTQGMDINAPCSPRETPFALGLASAGNLTLLAWAAGAGIDLHAHDVGGGTLISHALFNDNAEVVAWAIAQGARVDATNARGAGLVHQALEAGAAASLPLLLAAGAPVQTQDVDGNTALHVAAERNDLAVVSALLANGANARATNASGESPSDLAQGPQVRALLAAALRGA